ncbi:carboxymuconolactone decarboxylase family protein [bacterium]|nr:carboxymuconolactone decarboxylase family protein [bacterium]
MALLPSLEKNEVEEIAKEIYETFEKETGKVPEWVKVMAHRPEILKEFVELFKAIMGKGTIEPLLKWKIAYVVSQTLKCPFCLDVSEKMLKKFGAEDDVIQKIKTGEISSPEEKEILELVKDVTLDGHLDQPEIFEKLKEKFTPAQIIEIISVMGLFNYINRFNNTLAVLPE